MSRNKLIATGSTRLKKASDSSIDPAVPAELQKQAQEERSAFTGGRVLSAQDVTGSPEEQLAYVTERLVEIDALGRRSEDFVTLNKGALLEIAQERELHTIAGFSNFAQWGAEVLDVEPKYIFELLKDAQRIRALSTLGDDVTRLLTRASARKVVSSVLAEHGTDRAREVVEASTAEAKAQGKVRPTADLLSKAAKKLTAAVPPQGARSEISDPTRPKQEMSDGTAELKGAVTALKRAYAALAPTVIRNLSENETADALEVLNDAREQFDKVSRRLAAAERAVRQPQS